MGCQAVTPHLVGLARRLEGTPFHLIASHCQQGTQAEVVAYVKSKGLAADTPNVTVTQQGRHPGVKGNGYVPYYMVFDHTGRLAHHHMCGDYHGGDGLAMIEWVDKLLAATPAIYLGPAPFEHESALAAQVAGKKNLKAAHAAIQAKLAAPETDAAARVELERLSTALTDYRDRMLASAAGLLATRPADAAPALKDLARELKGTTLAEAVEARIAEYAASADVKEAIAVEKKFAKIVRTLEKRDPCKECERKGLDALVPGCATCRAEAGSALEKALEKLDELAVAHEALPIAATIRRYADGWR